MPVDYFHSCGRRCRTDHLDKAHTVAGRQIGVMLRFLKRRFRQYHSIDSGTRSIGKELLSAVRKNRCKIAHQHKGNLRGTADFNHLRKNLFKRDAVAKSPMRTFLNNGTVGQRI